MAAQYLALDSFWVDRSKYDEAERQFYERLGHETLTPLAAEVAKARQRIIEMMREVVDDGVIAVIGDGVNKGVEHPVKDKHNNKNKKGAVQVETQKQPSPPKPEHPKQECPKQKETTPVPVVAAASKTVAQSVQTNVDVVSVVDTKPISVPCNMSSIDASAMKFFEKQMTEFQNVIAKVQSQLETMDSRLASIEKSMGCKPTLAVCPAKPAAACKKPAAKEDDDDVDLFGSESEDDEAAAKVKEERLAAYNAKKSKKPALIAKSSIILDVKPWDDETDMKAMEVEVRKIVCEGLLWGASKLVPLAYGIKKLQINCVVEDEKVSIDWLQEQIEANEDFVQSVDIAAFNKI